MKRGLQSPASQKNCKNSKSNRQNATAATTTPWSESSLLFGGRKARYMPLVMNRVSAVQETPYRVLMLGDYASGVSLLRSEMSQVKSVKDIAYSDAECCTTITQDGRELQLWLFVDYQNFEVFCKQCTENIDCCMVCYSITVKQTYRNVVRKWIPGFVSNFPYKPIILCAVNDCESCTCRGDGSDDIMIGKDFNFCRNDLIRMDVSVFDKCSVKLLFDMMQGALINAKYKRGKNLKLKLCTVM